MNIFVIGPSGVGKSTFIKTITERFGESNFNIVSGGSWVVRLAEDLGVTWENRKERSEKLTALSVKKLAFDPGYAALRIKNHMRAGTINIVDGLRNPGDFTKLFEPREDMLITLRRAGNEQPPTQFDAGVSVIHDHACWMADNGLIRTNQLFGLHLKSEGQLVAGLGLIHNVIREALNG